MTREEAVQRLALCREYSDTEAAHSMADELICCLLTSLGYTDVVAEYMKVKRWYA